MALFANSRDQKMAAYAALPLLLAALYWYFLWSPQNVLLGESQSHVDSLAVINQRAKAELAQGKTNELKTEAERLTQDLAVMRLLVPTSNEVPALLDQVSSAARRVGLDIADVQPLPSLAGDQYEAYVYVTAMIAYVALGIYLVFRKILKSDL